MHAIPNILNLPHHVRPKCPANPSVDVGDTAVDQFSLTTSAPNVQLMPRSLVSQPLIFGSGSLHKMSHANPSCGTLKTIISEYEIRNSTTNDLNDAEIHRDLNDAEINIESFYVSFGSPIIDIDIRISVIDIYIDHQDISH
jgi:hypothetical protein